MRVAHPSWQDPRCLAAEGASSTYQLQAGWQSGKQASAQQASSPLPRCVQWPANSMTDQRKFTTCTVTDQTRPPSRLPLNSPGIPGVRRIMESILYYAIDKSARGGTQAALAPLVRYGYQLPHGKTWRGMETRPERTSYCLALSKYCLTSCKC